MQGDQPFIEDGQITDDKKGVIGSGDLLFATLRGTNETNSTLLEESKVELGSNNFDFKFPVPIERQQFGKLWCRAFFKEDLDIVLDGGISDSDTVANVTVNSGELPDSGHCLINDEICIFTKITATSIAIDRAVFNTEAVSHLTGAAVGFAISNQSCVNNYDIEFETQEGDLFRFRNFRFRGQ
jgi:hypothetical protein